MSQLPWLHPSDDLSCPFSRRMAGHYQLPHLHREGQCVYMTDSTSAQGGTVCVTICTQRDSVCN